LVLFENFINKYRNVTDISGWY